MRLEVLVKVEVTTVLSLVLGLGSSILMLLGSGSHDTSLLVVSNTLLEKVGLASQRDVLHEVEWVGALVVLLVAEGEEKTISDELNVLLHEVGVHAEESTWKGISEELLLDGNSLGDDVLNGLLAWAMLEVGEEKAGKVGVETLVTGDELVGEGKTGHETTLLEPEDRCEGTGEEDTLNSSKGDEALCKGAVLVLDPANSPVGLLLDTWDGLDGVEEVRALRLLLDVCVDEKRVCLGVDVLNHDLKTVEAASLWDLNLSGETLKQVLVDNAVGCGEEGKDVRDEVTLIVVETVVPVVQILGKINLLSSPERGLGLLVHLPDLWRLSVS